MSNEHGTASAQPLGSQLARSRRSSSKSRPKRRPAVETRRLNDAGQRNQTHPTAFCPSPVLKGESVEEFERFHDAVNDELKPRGLLERYWVADVAEKAWEIRRYSRVKTNLINSARRSAVRELLESHLEHSIGEYPSQRQAQIDGLTEQWFSDESDKREVLEILERHGLNESAVEAAAVRFVAPDLEKLDRLMASQEARLSKGLRLLAEFRGGVIGQQLRARVDRVIEGKTLALEDAAKKPPAAA